MNTQRREPKRYETPLDRKANVAAKLRRRQYQEAEFSAKKKIPINKIDVYSDDQDDWDSEYDEE
jgi:hypothetical protein